MLLSNLFLSADDATLLLAGSYNAPLVALSLFVAVLAGVMAFQLAGMARTEVRQFNRQTFLVSGAFVLGSGIWSMHFIGMLAYSVCSDVRYDTTITLASMLPSFLASWVALVLLSKDHITGWQLVLSGVSVGAGIGLMHYSGMAAVHHALVLKFDPLIFGVSIVVAVALSILALWLRFRLVEYRRLGQRQINLVSGVVLGLAITGMHYTGMQATGFLAGPLPDAGPVSNVNLALAIGGITTLTILITVGGNLLLRFRSLYQRMVQTETRTRTIMETAVDGIIALDNKGYIRDFNTAAEAIFGWSKQEIIGQSVDTLVPEDRRGHWESYVQSYFRGGISNIANVGQEILGLRRDGSTFPLRIAIGKADIQGETLFVGFIGDISERKHMETALRKSEEQYRSLIRNLPGIAFRRALDAQWSMRLMSDAVERLTGWAAVEFTSGRKSFVDLLHPEDRVMTITTAHNRLQAGQSYLVEYRILDRNGQEHWVSESASGVRGPEGGVDWIDGVIIDITDSKRRNAEFESVVNAISRSLAVVEFDLNGVILHANDTFLQITGYTLVELIGHHHSLFCSPAEVASLEYRSFWEALCKGNYHSGEYFRLGKGGKEIWIHGSYNPVLDPEGHPYKIIKFASDLSERHAMERDLREAKVKAEQAAAAKNTFLANMSHEIRTPMNAIIGFTEVLLSEQASDFQRRHLTTVRNAARSLLGLLNDILDTAKLERGAVELEMHNFSLRDVCLQVLATLQVTAHNKKLPVVLDYAPGTPEFFQGDALRLQQVLLNLVGNAIKFTERGQVRLEVNARAGEVHLVVHDTGIGIPAERLASIFDPFAQADASMSRRFGGTGLGTTIARQLIELMGGRIRVESEVGVGSRFQVDIPLQPGEAVSTAQAQPTVALPPLRILAADDVPQNLELLQLLLTPHGHTLTTASNGREAVDAFAAGTFDIVLMDVQMPVLNGLEASREIRRFEAAHHRDPTPIIAFSASVLEADVKEARSAGMDGFAHKPVDWTLLTQEIAHLLKLETTTAATSARAAAHDTDNGWVIDWQQGQLLWGSEQRHREAIRRFLADIGNVLPRLQALLPEPLALAAELHKLRGAAANLALQRIATVAAHAESAAQRGDEACASLLQQLGDELAQVAAAAQLAPGAAALPQAPGASPAADPTLVLQALARLDTALARSELAEAELAALAKWLPQAAYQALDDAINSFDFDTARHLIKDLQTRYRPDRASP